MPDSNTSTPAAPCPPAKRDPLGEMLLYIRETYATQRYPLTVKQITTDLGVSSTSVTAYRLGKLERAGFVQREPGIARTIRPRTPDEPRA